MTERTSVEFYTVSTTTSDQTSADRIATELVARRLAACVHVSGPISSTYWWKGAVEISEEWQLIIKTSELLYPQLEAVLTGLHPYETPQIVATPLVRVAEPYARWLREELRRQEGSGREGAPHAGPGGDRTPPAP